MQQKAREWLLPKRAEYASVLDYDLDLEQVASLLAAFAAEQTRELTAAYAELEKAAQFAQEEVEAVGGGHPAGNPVLFRVREHIRTALDRVRKAKTH